MTALSFAATYVLMYAMVDRFARKLNVAIIAVSIVALAGFWAAIRQQSAVSDQQFLRSMIPHHAGAILMCEQASIRDADIQKLCRTIIASQVDEIRQMKVKLEELEG
jgi:uncharacterized protein (DUF305 family)